MENNYIAKSIYDKFINNEEITFLSTNSTENYCEKGSIKEWEIRYEPTTTSCGTSCEDKVFILFKNFKKEYVFVAIRTINEIVFKENPNN